MASSNIIASNAGGNLTITQSDGLSHSFSLSTVHGGAHDGEVMVTGGLINGVKAPFYASVTGSVSVTMGDGSDKLKVSDINVPGHLTVLMGGGNDNAQFDHVSIGTFLHFEGGAGNDTLKINDMHVSDPTFAFFSTIDMQDGNDKATISNFTDQDLQVTLGNGNDSFGLQDSTFLGGPFQRLRVDAGDGFDHVDLERDATGPLFVDIGPGDPDKLVIMKFTADTETLLATDSPFARLSLNNNDFANDPSIDPNFFVI